MSKFLSKQINLSGSDLPIGLPSGGSFGSIYLNPSMSIADGINITTVSASVFSSSFAQSASYAPVEPAFSSSVENRLTSITSSLWTGSGDYISRNSDVQISGSLNVSDSGSFNYLEVVGNTIEADNIIINETASLKGVTIISGSEGRNSLFLDVYGAAYFAGGTGDSNNSGIITVADENDISTYLAGTGTLTKQQFAVYDIDGNGIVNWTDFTLLDQFQNQSLVISDPGFEASKSKAVQNLHSHYGMIASSAAGGSYGFYSSHSIVVGGKLLVNLAQNNLTVVGRMVVGGLDGVPPFYNIAAPETGALFAGTVGIGTSAPAVQDKSLHVWNDVSASNFYGGGANITGVISSSYAPVEPAFSSSVENRLTSITSSLWTGSGDYISRNSDVQITGSLNIDLLTFDSSSIDYISSAGIKISTGVLPPIKPYTQGVYYHFPLIYAKIGLSTDQQTLIASLPYSPAFLDRTWIIGKAAPPYLNLMSEKENAEGSRNFGFLTFQNGNVFQIVSATDNPGSGSIQLIPNNNIITLSGNVTASNFLSSGDIIGESGSFSYLEVAGNTIEAGTGSFTLIVAETASIGYLVVDGGTY